MVGKDGLRWCRDVVFVSKLVIVRMHGAFMRVLGQATRPCLFIGVVDARDLKSLSSLAVEEAFVLIILLAL